MINPETLVRNQIIAVYSPEQMELLMHYDHYAVNVQGRLGVMLSDEWMSHYEWEDTKLLRVVFDAVEAYPLAPPAVQALIDDLTV